MRCTAFIPLLVVLTCGPEVPRTKRGVITDPLIRESIDWTQSVGIFIGIETFLATTNAPTDVRYAADDATDLAWLFAEELPSLLSPDRTLLVLSGRPHKRASKEHLLLMQRKGSAVANAIDADSIYALIRESAKKVGPNGVLILSIATHGYTSAGGHVLLTPDATTVSPKGVVLNRMLEAIPVGHGNRVLLFVDACRKPFAPAPARLFEELQFPGDYAIFAATGPGGYARANEDAQNGFFTSAVIDGLRGRATPDADGYVTPGTLDVHVSRQVRESTHNEQRPEARFGGLTDLPLFRNGPTTRVASIVAPQSGAEVTPLETIDVLVYVPHLYITVLVCSATTRRCWKQNTTPIAASAKDVTHVGVQFGDSDIFRVHVALTADEAFLRGETRFSSVPLDRRADRIVYWLPPVTVTRKEKT